MCNRHRHTHVEAYNPVTWKVMMSFSFHSKLSDLLQTRATVYPDESFLPLILPPPSLCTDNGVMVAWAGIEKLKQGISDNPDDAFPISRWPLGSLVGNGKEGFAKIPKK